MSINISPDFSQTENIFHQTGAPHLVPKLRLGTHSPRSSASQRVTRIKLSQEQVIYRVDENSNLSPNHRQIRHPVNARTVMWISPSYESEYRNWLSDGMFERLINREHSTLSKDLQDGHPALISTSLSAMSVCYYTRGAVSLLDKNEHGWGEIQCGYWASLYSLRYEVISTTLPAWSLGRSFHRGTELIVALGFSRLFNQKEDERWLRAVAADLLPAVPIVSGAQPGGKLINAMLNETVDATYEEILSDRMKCCQTREAYPKRPTELRPVGIIDIEQMLHFPNKAAFSYSQASFGPTVDQSLEEAIVDYHVNY